MAVHGDITEIKVNHPILGSKTFFPKAAEGNTLDPGGIRTSDDANSVTSISMILQKNRVRASFEVLIENDMNIREDADFIKDLMESPVTGDWTISIINGAVFAGAGIPVGDLNVDVNAGTMTLKVASLEFKKILG